MGHRRHEGTSAKAPAGLRALVALTALGLLVAGGCAPRPDRPLNDREVELAARDVPAETPDPLRRLNEQVNRFIEHVDALPGRTLVEHRQIMERVLMELEEILPRLAGAQPGGAFRQQMYLIESSRRRLAAAPPEVRIEPTIDMALRAAYGAMETIDQRYFADEREIRSTLDDLGTTVRELDAVRGPMHRIVTTQAVGLIAQVMQQMTAVLVDQETGQQEEAAVEEVEADNAGGEGAP